MNLKKSLTHSLPEHCWKVIGVWGNQSIKCDLLATVIHCHNCEIFTQAGRNLLERELPPEYQEEWKEVFASRKAETELNTLSILIFRIENEWLALPASAFAEVIEATKPHTVPHRANPVLLGLVNIHGEIQLCVSLKALLGIQTVANLKNAYTRMLVMRDKEWLWVFPVNEIYGVYHLSSSCLETPPATVIKSENSFSKHIFVWEQRRVALLDIQLVLTQLEKQVKMEH